MEWIYLSPHIDDVALSCGGLVWEQRGAGVSASIWTVCAGAIPAGPLSPFAMQLHRRWRSSRSLVSGPAQEAGDRLVELRRLEDSESCRLLSAAYRHLDIPDCIYRFVEESPGRRSHLYAARKAIFGSLHAADIPLVDQLAAELDRNIEQASQLVCPLGLGNHVDHQLTRMAAERLARPLWYYADFPYTRADANLLDRLAAAGWEMVPHPISSDGLAAWQASVAAHGSQISTFWATPEDMRTELEQYAQSNGGVRLWRPNGLP